MMINKKDENEETGMSKKDFVGTLKIRRFFKGCIFGHLKTLLLVT